MCKVINFPLYITYDEMVACDGAYLDNIGCYYKGVYYEVIKSDNYGMYCKLNNT